MQLDERTKLNGQLGAILADATTSELHRTLERVNGERARLNALGRELERELHVRSNGHNNNDYGCVAGARCSDRDEFAYALKSNDTYRWSLAGAGGQVVAS